MSTTTKTRHGSTRGAGRAVLDAALAQRQNVDTNGGLRGQVWTDSWMPHTGQLNGEEVAQLRADIACGLSYIVWSYATPIAWVRADGSVYFVRQSFSVTTSKHQSIVRNAL